MADIKLEDIMVAIHELSNQVKNVDTKVTSTESRVTDIESRMTNVETKVTNMETELKDIKHSIHKMDKKFTILSDSILEAQADIAILQKAIN